MFDKTGTLTTGKPVVVSTRLLKNMVLRDFYECVAAAEVKPRPLYVKGNASINFSGSYAAYW